uniref:Uncharacterized protein n=1 Tax=Setaria viridis TaxID=4556 RepID=A0A4U6WC31_SETVI|nr:hypothetical protein SEVIR_1G218950v2 [Setaria viridis]
MAGRTLKHLVIRARPKPSTCRSAVTGWVGGKPPLSEPSLASLPGFHSRGHGRP